MIGSSCVVCMVGLHEIDAFGIWLEELTGGTL